MDIAVIQNGEVTHVIVWEGVEQNDAQAFVQQAFGPMALAMDASAMPWIRPGMTLLDGKLPPEPVHTVPPEAMQQRFADAIQKRLDDFARTRGYDGIMSAATYATSAVPKFKAEGQYAVEIRDATWAKGYALLADVLAGKRPMPSVRDVFTELPPLVWPEVANA